MDRADRYGYGLFDEFIDFRSEPGSRKPDRICAACLPGDGHLQRLEPFDSLADRIGRLMVEQHARRGATLRDDDVQCATTAVGDDRGAAGLRLDQGNAEIFLCGEHECTGTLHQIDQIRLRDDAPELDVRPPGGSQTHPIILRSVPYDDEATPGHAGEGLDDDVGALVRHEPAGEQEELLLGYPDVEPLDIDRRMNDRCVTSVGLHDAPGNIAGICYEMIDMMGARDVPLTQPCEQPA